MASSAYILVGKRAAASSHHRIAIRSRSFPSSNNPNSYDYLTKRLLSNNGRPTPTPPASKGRSGRAGKKARIHLAQEVRNLVGNKPWTRAKDPRRNNTGRLDGMHFKTKEESNQNHFRRQSEARGNTERNEISRAFGSQEMNPDDDDDDDIFGLAGISAKLSSDKRPIQKDGFATNSERGRDSFNNNNVFEGLGSHKEIDRFPRVQEAPSGGRDSFGAALGKLASQVKDESSEALVNDEENGTNAHNFDDSRATDISVQKDASLEGETKEGKGSTSELSEDKNIFDTDVFNIPPPPPIKEDVNGASEADKNIFLKVYWEHLDIHTDPEQNKKFIRPGKKNKMTEESIAEVVAYLREPDLVVELHYPSFDEMIRSKGETAYDRKVAKAEAKAQADMFLREMNFDDKQERMVHAALRHIASICAKNNAPEAFPILWQKAKEVGLVDEKQLVVLLHLGANLFLAKTRELEAKMKQSSGTPSVLDLLDKGSAILENQKKVLEPSDYDEETSLVYDKLEELFTFITSHYTINEQMVHTRMRLLIAQGRGKEAYALLKESEAQSKLHLRSFTPVLGLFLDQKDMESAVAIYSDMQRISTVHFDSDTYIQLLAALAETGYLKPDFQQAESTSLGPIGPSLFHEIASTMSEDILEISLANAKRMHNGLARGFEDSGLQWISALETMQFDMEPDQKPVIASRVRIDHDNGYCQKSGIKLRLKKLTDEQCEKLIAGCRGLASSRQKEWHKIHKLGPIKERADDGLMDFLDWLDNREGEPYTAVIDAANIGYHMQNFEGGSFTHAQIKFVVDHLVAQGENPLVVMPHKYTKKYFITNQNVRQYLSEQDYNILSEFHNADRLFIVPPGFLDDFYWIVASISKQRTSSKSQDLSVPLDAEHRMPGARPFLLSNDQMRDHKLGMIEPFLFRRWYSNFIVNFNFAAFVNGRPTQEDIGFSAADFFSREIQSNTDANGNIIWHFPIDSDYGDEWLCVSIKN